MLDGLKEICNNMQEELKYFWRKELEDIKKEMGELRQEVQNSSQKIEKN